MEGGSRGGVSLRVSYIDFGEKVLRLKIEHRWGGIHARSDAFVLGGG